MYRHAFLMKTDTRSFKRGQIVFWPGIASPGNVKVIGKSKREDLFITDWVKDSGDKEYIKAKYIGRKKIEGFNRRLIFLYEIYDKYHFWGWKDRSKKLINVSSPALIKYAKKMRSRYKERTKQIEEDDKKNRLEQDLLAEQWRDENPEYKMSVNELKKLSYLRG